MPFPNPTPERQQIFDEFHSFLVTQSFEVDIAKVMLPGLEKCGLEDVSKTDFYSLRDEIRESAAQAARVWELRSFPPIFSMIYAKTDEGEKRSAEELVKVVDEKTKQMRDFQAGGGVPDITLVVIVGRK